MAKKSTLDTRKKLSIDKVDSIKQYGFVGDVYAENLMILLNDWHVANDTYTTDRLPWWAHLKDKEENVGKDLVDVIYGGFLKLKGGTYNGS